MRILSGKKSIAATPSNHGSLINTTYFFCILVLSAAGFAFGSAAKVSFIQQQQARNSSLLKTIAPEIQTLKKIHAAKPVITSSGSAQKMTGFSAPRMCHKNRLPQTAMHIQMPKVPVLIFISFSMPRQSLREWLDEADKIRAPLILNGLVKNNMAYTAKAVRRLIKHKANAGLAIDPIWFQRYHIERVPAVVVRGNDLSPDIVYGNSSLQAALRLVKKQGVHSVEAAAALRKLQGKQDE